MLKIIKSVIMLLAKPSQMIIVKETNSSFISLVKKNATFCISSLAVPVGYVWS